MPADDSQIRTYLLFLHPDGPWVIGVLSSLSKGLPAVAFHDVDRAVAYAQDQSAKPTTRAVYAALHRCSDDIFRKKTLADGDVTFLTNFLVDIDRPLRHVKENASEPELEQVRLAAELALRELRPLADCAPIQLDSGNGCALVFPLPPHPNTPDNARLLERAVKGTCDWLNAEFEARGIAAEVDVAVYNPGRWTRLAGTMNRKYPETAGKPHRVARLIHADVVRREAVTGFLGALADKCVQIATPPGATTDVPALDAQFNLRAFFEHFHLEVVSTSRKAGLDAYHLSRCPFDPDEQGGPESRPAIIVGKTLGFKCHYPACDGKTIKDLLRRLEEKHGKYPHPIWTTNSRRLIVRRDTEVVAEVIHWLNEGIVPLGKVTVFAGDPGIGKSLTAQDLGARYSSGGEFPNQKVCSVEAGEVMCFSAEDGYADTVKPRLMAAGFRQGSFHFVEGCVVKDQPSGQVALDTDLGLIREYLAAHPRIKLVIIDPLSSYFGKKELNRAEHCRQILDPLGKLAADLQVAIVIVAHFSKNIGLDAAKKVAGSVAIVAAARLAWGFFKDLTTSSPHVHMLVIKSNVTGTEMWRGFKYRVKRVDHPVDPTNKVGIARIEWEGDSKLSADEIVSEREAPDFTDVSRCAEWLREYLQDEKKKKVGEIKQEAMRRGYPEKTVERAAKRLGMKKEHEKGTKNYFWELAAEEQENIPF